MLSYFWMSLEKCDPLGVPLLKGGDGLGLGPGDHDRRNVSKLSSASFHICNCPGPRRLQCQRMDNISDGVGCRRMHRLDDLDRHILFADIQVFRTLRSRSTLFGRLYTLHRLSGLTCLARLFGFTAFAGLGGQMPPGGPLPGASPATLVEPGAARRFRNLWPDTLPDILQRYVMYKWDRHFVGTQSKPAV